MSTSTPEFDLVLLASSDDVALIKKPYCNRCANEKLDILKAFSASQNDIAWYKQNKDVIKAYNIKCECQK